MQPSKSPRQQRNYQFQSMEPDYHESSTLNQSMDLMKMAAMMNYSKSQANYNDYYHTPEKNSMPNPMYAQQQWANNQNMNYYGMQPQMNYPNQKPNFMNSQNFEMNQNYDSSGFRHSQPMEDHNPFTPTRRDMDPNEMHKPQMHDQQPNMASPEGAEIKIEEQVKAPSPEQPKVEPKPNPDDERELPVIAKAKAQELAEKETEKTAEKPRPTIQDNNGSTTPPKSGFNVDDISIQTKKLTFEELLAQHLKDGDLKDEEHIFGKQKKTQSKYTQEGELQIIIL